MHAQRPPVLQAVYSDGLTQVSLFVEPIEKHKGRGPMRVHVGATHTLMQPYADDWWVTVMGDVPAATLEMFYKALERKR